ncbi:hypothetical protein [Paracraurococcus ruber]|uniref:Uncharacterized protein n=1 Tax=Paracraurococcus ruber TaxID=77675 RepID=A0ABS1CX02_9PROT|nr:hypothetical protein [Paracraurococcus ruber]MBK1658846.1 hypothetical protein [Paracraurococcus ruber]TDG32740.1 hypothetical protein E2C05_05840 [Paracraurococcus ruber]
MPVFWRRWLAAWCGAVGVFGLVLMGGAIPATERPVLLLLHGLGGAPVAADPPLRFALGVLGAVSLGWALGMLAAFRAAEALGPQGRPVWMGLTAGVLAWFACDSALSVITGFWPNVVPNLLLLGTYLLAVIRGGALRR